jgi:hypothetical protein
VLQWAKDNGRPYVYMSYVYMSGGALAAQVWIWGSLVQRIVLRVLHDTSHVERTTLDGTQPRCVRLASGLPMDQLASGGEEPLRICGAKGAAPGECGVASPSQIPALRGAACSTEAALVAFAWAAPLTLAISVVAERARRRFVPVQFFLILACVGGIADLAITALY